MRFFVGRHYRDEKFRDGEDIYVAFITEAPSSKTEGTGNLVNIRTGITYFMEDFQLYQYEVDGEAKLCFDATPMLMPDRFLLCEVIIDYADVAGK